MTNFWDFESSDSYNGRKAQTWAQQHQADAQDFATQLAQQAHGVPDEATQPLSPDSIFGPKNLLTGNDLDSIQPKPKDSGGGGGVLGALKDVVGDVTDKVFLGPISKPWDLLRPIARGLEAEQKYIATPIAKAAISPFADYDTLPTWAKMGATTLFDPLTYIGPGGILKAAKVAKVGWEAKMIAPALEELFLSPGSKRLAAHMLESAGMGLSSVAGAEAARTVGLPSAVGGMAAPFLFGRARSAVDNAWDRTAPVGAGKDSTGDLYNPTPGDKLSIINPEDQRVYHGTVRDFEQFDPSKTGTNFEPTDGHQYQFDNSVYVTKDPTVASTYADINTMIPDNNPNITKGESPPGANVRPLTLTAGSKLYDPWQPGWRQQPLVDDYDFARASDSRSPDYNSPEMVKLRETDAYKAQEILNGLTGHTDLDGTFHEGSQDPNWTGPMFDDVPTADKAIVKSALEKAGYHGIDTPHETILFDKTRLRNAYTGGQAIVPFNKDNPPPGAVQNENALGQQRMADQAWIGDFNKRMTKGDIPTDAEIDKAQDIIKRWQSFGPGTGVGPGTPPRTPLSDLMYNIQSAPVDYFAARNRDELNAYADQTRSLTQWARGKVGESLTGQHLSKIKQFITKGVRLEDTQFTNYINENMRMRALGAPNGAVTTQTLENIRDAANKSGVLKTADINLPGQTASVIRDPALIDMAKQVAAEHPELKLLADGQLHLGDLVENAGLFNLSPAQQSVIDQLHTAWAPYQEFESYFGLDSPTTTDNGGYVAHRQLVKTESPDISGVLVESPTGPVVAARPGTRQSFQRERTVPSISAGIAAGNKYLPFNESQGARVQQGFSAMADKWLDAALDEVGKKPVDLLPQGLVSQLTDLSDARKQHNYLTKELTRAYQSGAKRAWIPPKWTPNNQEIQDVLDIANQAKDLPKMADRRAVWGAVRDRVQSMDDAAKAAQAPLAAQKQTLLKQIVAGEDLSARGDYPVSYNNRYFEANSGAEQLNDLDKWANPTGIDRTLNQINDSVRPIQATLDASFLGVQGLLALFSDPRSYFTAAKQVFTGGYGDWFDSFKQSGAMDAAIRDGLHFGAKNDFSEFIFPSAISRLPVIGRAADLSNAWFTQFGNVLRGEMYKGVVHDFDSSIEGQAAKAQMIRNINLISGYTPTNPSGIEKTLTFAPRFMRSQLGLVADAVTKRQLSDMGAARALGSLALFGTLSTMALNEVLGNKTDFDPNSPNFMRVRFGGQDTSLFGTWDTLMRAVSKTADGGPVDGFDYLARSKSSPAMAKLLDIMNGQTISGQKLEGGSVSNILKSAGNLALSVGPISATQLAQNLPNPLNPGEDVMAAAQFLGPKATPLSPSENMAIKRDSLANQQFGKDWADLEPYQQDTLRKENSLDIPSNTEISKQFDFRRAIAQNFTTQQQKLDSGLPVGKDWIDQYHNLKHEQVGAFAQWAQQNPEAAAQMRTAKPKNDLEAARQSFYNLFDQADKQDWSPDELDAKLSEFQSSITPEQQAYIDRNSGLQDTPRVKQYKAAQKTLAPYWNLQDQVWEKLKDRLPDGQQFNTLQEYSDAFVQKMQDAGIPDSTTLKRLQTNPVMREIDRATQTLRDRYRATHPNVDAELVRWYGYTPKTASGRTAVPASASVQ